jgi:hypothetical protein
MRMALDGIAGVKLLTEFNLNGIASVIKAHYHFYRSIPSLNRKRKKARLSGHFIAPAEKLHRSIVFQFYIRKRKRFSEIKF